MQSLELIIELTKYTPSQIVPSLVRELYCQLRALGFVFRAWRGHLVVRELYCHLRALGFVFRAWHGHLVVRELYCHLRALGFVFRV